MEAIVRVLEENHSAVTAIQVQRWGLRILPRIRPPGGDRVLFGVRFHSLRWRLR